jgi:hypothetical protein
VTARVVEAARIEAPVRVAEGVSRQVPGGTEWRVELAAPAARLEVWGGCPGVRLSDAGRGARRAVWVFVPDGSRCTPTLRATVFADAAQSAPVRN